jgi:two-component system repressor protein LuxO
MPDRPKHKILLVEDVVALATTFGTHLENDGAEVHICHTAAEALDNLEQHVYSLILLDLQLPDSDGLQLLEEIRRSGIQSNVIVVTSNASADLAVEAMRMGARDYLVKPLTPNRLLVTVRNTLELVSLEERVRNEKKLAGFEGFIGSSDVMQAIYRTIENISQSRATVFISGESGTGKELCAEAIHRQSPRRKGPFIAVNCGAIPKDLIETELFGHVKGSFTGAVSDRQGAASLANGGTLFLDEICEMALALQTKLLRFLQTGSLQRIGSEKLEHVDVRVLCATNKDPYVETMEGRFREDLYYRLNVIPIYMPPLRERGDDAVQIATELVERFSREEGKQFSGISPVASASILNYSWHGNVRELANVVRRVVVMHEGPVVELGMLPDPIRKGVAPSGAPADVGIPAPGMPPMTPLPERTAQQHPWVPEGRTLASLEREIIEATIDRCQGNVPRAAAVLGVSPSTLYRKRTSWQRKD